MATLADQLELLSAALTVPEVARFLACSEKLVYKLVSRGAIPHQRIGGLLRFDPQLIAAWWRERTVAPRRKA